MLAARSRVVQDVEAVGYGRERIAQLMRKHGQKLVFVAIRLAQHLRGLARSHRAFLQELLGPLALRRIAEDHGEATGIRAPGVHLVFLVQLRHAVFDPRGHAAFNHPAKGLDPVGLDSGDDFPDRSSPNLVDGKTGQAGKG